MPVVGWNRPSRSPESGLSHTARTVVSSWIPQCQLALWDARGFPIAIGMGERAVQVSLAGQDWVPIEMARSSVEASAGPLGSPGGELKLRDRACLQIPFATIQAQMEELRTLIREVPDFPKQGILFYDITTALKDARGLSLIAEKLAENASSAYVDLVAGVEARGFLFGPLVAQRLGVGFALMRKAGKLPAATTSISYDLEYGTDSLEMHTDAVQLGQRVLLVDDLLATGGTAAAAAALVEQLGGTVAGFAFVIELDFLNGRDRLRGYEVSSLLHYAS